MTHISAVIITFNEEKNIARCLASLEGIVDDVVVVDSFSSDRTEELCLAHGARFVSHAFEGHIQQKNWALTQAKYPYVLSLDADEALDDTLKAEILRIKNGKEKLAEGYYMNRLTNYCGKWVHHCGWYPDRKLRLWDASKGAWGGDNPHDKFELTAGDQNTQQLKGDILHYSYYTREDHYKQVEYFTTILAKAQFGRGKKAPFLTLIFSPIVKFIKDYIIHLGFLDGRTGFVICRISAYATFIKYRKLRQLIRAKHT